MTKNSSQCETSQIIISNFKNDPANDLSSLNLVLEGFIELKEGAFGNAEMDAAIEHFYNCDDCQLWTEKTDPEIAKARKRIRAITKRMTKYCCAHMFNAVNDKDAKIKFEFAYFRDDPCWCINESWEFANFCPWCGTALPANKSFE